jgi:Fe2+ transport system protein FeoA
MPGGRPKGYPKTGGKKKGSVNKISLAKEVAARLEELGCDPIAGLATIAGDPAVDHYVRVRCYSELAQYLYPKRRAIEHSGPGGGPIPISADPFDAITRELSRIAERAAAGADSTRVQ